MCKLKLIYGNCSVISAKFKIKYNILCFLFDFWALLISCC